MHRAAVEVDINTFYRYNTCWGTVVRDLNTFEHVQALQASPYLMLLAQEEVSDCQG